MAKKQKTGYLSARRIKKLQERILRLQQKLHEYQQYECSSLMMGRIDSNLRLQSWNRALAHFIGISYLKASDKPISDFIHSDDYEAFAHAFSQFRYQTAFLGQQIRIITGDGSYQTTTWHLHQIKNEKNVHVIVKQGTDIHNEVDRLAQLEAQNRELETKLLQHKRNEAKLNHQSKLLKRSNEELDRFAHITAHDLREPLRNIASHIQILEKQYGRQLDEKAVEHLDFVVRGVKNLETVIKDLLMYSELGNRNFKLENVQTQDIVREQLRSCREQIQEKGVHVELGELPIVKADSYLLRHLFTQLIDNALKYNTALEPEITINGKSRETCWQFSVTDNGPGISPDYQERVFILFQRLHIQDKSDGTGAGLAIAKKIAELHLGSIWLESDGQQGTTVHFTIGKNLEVER